MWFGRNMAKQFLIALAMAVPAMAANADADVAPFYFGSNEPVSKADSAKNQAYWDILMKYKIFGERGINFIGTNIRVTDSSGWFGTAKGDFNMEEANNHHVVGGPILIGGDIVLSNGQDTISTGPVRVTKNVRLGQNGNLAWGAPNLVNGPQCIYGSAVTEYNNAVAQKPVFSEGTCPDTVPQIDTTLTIPNFHYDGSYIHEDLTLNNEMKFIDVPAGGDIFDYYIGSIRFSNNSILVIRMPAGGRLTRIFVRDDIDFGSAHPKIRIVYMDSSVTWNTEQGKWNSDGFTFTDLHHWSVDHATAVENIDYAGNLLFYTPRALVWNALVQQDSMQGTFISGDTILIKQQMTLAGQLLATKVTINANFDGSGFRYVPFNPDTLKIDPKAISGGKFPESDADSLVPVKLDSPAQIDVYFKYCFDVSKTSTSSVYYADAADFNVTSKSKFPICKDDNSVYESVKIKQNTQEPTPDTRIYINVLRDGKPEKDEILILRVFDLSGAVMPNKQKFGEFELIIADAEAPKFDDTTSHYFVKENSSTDLVFATIPIKNVDIDDEDKFNELRLEFVDNNPVTGKSALDLFDTALVRDVDAGQIYVQLKVKDSTKLDYESIASSFSVTLTIKDRDGVEGCAKDTIIRTINVIDVNEVPAVADTVFSVKENASNGTTVGTVVAKDPDTKNKTKFGHVEYFMEDTSLPFSIPNKNNGIIKVSDSKKLDFETVPDHKFVFNVLVKNCELNPATNNYDLNCLDTVSQVTVMLMDVNEPPVIVRDSTDHYDIWENTPTGVIIKKFAIYDVDADDIADNLVISLTGNDNKTGFPKAEELFTVTEHPVLQDDTLWLVLSVKDSSLLDYETVKSSYKITLTLKDSGGVAGCNKDTVIRTINIIDINEAPVLSGKDTTMVIPENLANGEVAGVVPASDPDTKNVKKFGHLEFSILDQNMPFVMDSNRIVVTNVDTLNYEALKPDTTFTFFVQVENCELNSSTGRYDGACLYDTSKVTVAVKDVNEPPVIDPDDPDDGDDDADTLCVAFCDTTSRGDSPDSVLTVAVKENVPTNYVVFSYTVADEDLGVGHADKLTASLKNTNSSGADSLFKIEMKKVSGKWKVVVSVADSSKLDYEKIKPTHNVTIVVTDPKGKTDSLRRIIKVIDVNEAPSLADAEFNVDENTPVGTVVQNLVASDPDSKNVDFRQLTYSIVTPNVPFTMDSNKVVVSGDLNYEKIANKTFTFTVKVQDKKDSTLYDTAVVKVHLQDVDEPPFIDPDDDDDGDDDTETKCVAHCDTTNRGSGDHGKNILTVAVDENSSTGTVVLEYFVYDEDANDVKKLVPSMSLISTNISGPSVDEIFEITKTQVGEKWKIVVSVKDSSLLDYETLRNAKSNSDPDPQYTVAIIVTDPADASNLNSKELKDTVIRVIEIHDVNETPTFVVQPCEVAENNAIGDSIGHVEHGSDIDSMARDSSLYSNNRYKLLDGDTTLFGLDTMGNVIAKVVFDCESGEYVCGTDQVYWIDIEYYDSKDSNLAPLVRHVPITIIDVNELPVIATDTIGVDENSPKGTVVDTVKASDIDVYDTVLTYTIVEDNSGCFDISKNSGVVTVKVDNCKALDYEKNPELPIKVKVTDTKNADVTKTVKVNVHDVNESPTINNQTFYVSEDTKPVVVVDTVVARDPDTNPGFNKLTYYVTGGDTAVFAVDSVTGALTLKDTLDYESDSIYTLKIRVVDNLGLFDTATVTIKVKNVIEICDVEIIEVDSDEKTWEKPDTVYTNRPIRNICWVQDGYDTCKTVNIAKDTLIVIEYLDPTKDSVGRDSVMIYYSTSTPYVTVSAYSSLVTANNIYTIVEKTANNDTTIYVNNSRNNIYVTIKDTASHKDTSFVETVNLKKVNISEKTYDHVESIVKERIVLTDKPSKNVIAVPTNNSEIKMYYDEVVGKDTVTVSYTTDSKGEPKKVAVIGDDGKVDYIEVITVSYKTTVKDANGRDQVVTISYQADALTGQLLETDPEGRLMTSAAADAKRKESKNSKSDSTGSIMANTDFSTGCYTISYNYYDAYGNAISVSYVADSKGNLAKNSDGDTGYSVTYTYVNSFGNSATCSVFIVLDQVPPKVQILYPENGQVIRSNYVNVSWTVNGVKQDTLIVQGLEKGANIIVRFFRDKAGNEASDTVFVVMKDSKNVDVRVETPVVEMTKEKIEQYYAENPPQPGETYAISVRNPTTGKEVETMVGGKFKTKAGSGEEPYPGMEDGSHLGPTLAMDVRLPSVSDIGGLATLDDLLSSDGLVPLEGVDAENSRKVTVEEYVSTYCDEDVSATDDLTKVNLYKSRMQLKIWTYTSLGNFVDYYHINQDLNNPEYANEAGMLQMYFELKPGVDGELRTKTGRMFATGAYLFKVDAKIRSTLRCTLPPVDDPSGKKRGEMIKSSDDLLRPFGFKRPAHRHHHK